MELIRSTDAGLYCEAGDFYIDAWRGVPRNVVTHGHSDHARMGSERYLAASDCAAVLRKRLGSGITLDTIEYGQRLNLNGVQVSLHPAGHILGASQVRVEHRGEVWVFTGDYKTQSERTCRPFDLVCCHTLITECTFGLPLFRWGDPARVAGEMNDWWRKNAGEGRTSLLLAYSLGKAQRVLSELDSSIGPILLHGSVFGMTEAYRETGVKLPAAEYASDENAKAYRGKALIIAPPSAMNSPWARKFSPLSTGVASGWMQVRGFRRRRAADRGFVLSDHVDWPALLQTIKETGAQRIIATHGYTGPLVRFLTERGMDAQAFETRFKSEGDDAEQVPEAPVSAAEPATGDPMRPAEGSLP